jgi:hypothetical protein
VKATKLKGLIKKGGIAQMVHLCAVESALVSTAIPASIQQLVDNHSHMFKEPDSLPPSRPCDNTIPLLSGVKSVNVKPYKYNPTQKDEIERQIQEMTISSRV